jgi:hypothetical protein
MVLIVDGMDRSKFALPRWHEGRAPKHASVEHTRRPVLELSAVIVHGVGVYLFLADEDVSIGANWTCEVVLAAMDKAMLWYQTKGKRVPVDVAITADNTNREAKNSIFSRLCAFLTAGRYFRTAGHQHLRVGHTHEDVGNSVGNAWRCSTFHSPPHGANIAASARHERISASC